MTIKTMGQDDTNINNQGTDNNDNDDNRDWGMKTNDKEDNNQAGKLQCIE